MQALPSIAFGGFSGSAKGVTARQVAGRTILSVKSWPTGPTTNAQVARRASMSKISKSWKLLTNEQMQEWDRLAEHASGQSAFGQKAELSLYPAQCEQGDGWRGPPLLCPCRNGCRS